MKLLLSITLPCFAAGVFVGLSINMHLAWLFAAAWAVWTGVRWVRAEIESTPTINEVEV